MPYPTQYGRISGPLLKENLTRSSDLAFETDLLFIGHTNDKIGIRTDAPTRELTIVGTTKIPQDLLATNSTTFGNMLFDQDGIRALTGPITISTGAGGSINYDELRTEHISFTNSTIKAFNTNSDIEFHPGPGGLFRITGGLKTINDSDIHATGDITFDGNVFIGGDSDEDTIKFEGDITSNLNPDQSLTYDIGENSKRWGYFHVKSMPNLNNITIDNFISLNGVAVNLGITNKWYVTTDGTDSLSGTHPNFAFGTIKHTLDQLESSTGGPHEIHVFPGTYEENFPMEIPENVTIKGVGQGTVLIKSPVITGDTAFYLNDNTSVQNVTIDVTGSNAAFRFATGTSSVINTGPYIADVKVKGLLGVLSAEQTNSATYPPAPGSQPSITFKNVDCNYGGGSGSAIQASNGVRVEMIDCTIENANSVISASHGLFGFGNFAYSGNPSHDNSDHIYGTDIRAVGCIFRDITDAVIQAGYHGHVGDDILINLIGCTFINVEQTTSITECLDNKNPIIYTNIFDDKGIFRMGQEEATISSGDIPTPYNLTIRDDETTFKSSSMTLEYSHINFRAPDSTFIASDWVEAGDFTLTENTIQSNFGDMNLKATSGTTNIQTDTKIHSDLDVTGNTIIGGSMITLGDQPTDTIDFSMQMTQDLMPTGSTVQNLGSATKNWFKTNFSTVDVGDITAYNNVMTTTVSNADLEMRGSGTGNVIAVDLTFGTGIDSPNDIVLDAGSSTVTIDSTSALNLPTGTSAQRQALTRELRFNTDTNLYETHSTGVAHVGGVRDADLDTYIDVSSNNEMTFYGGGNNIATLDGAGVLTATKFSSQDEFALDGNSVTVGSPGAEAGLEANGTGKVILDTSNFTMSGGVLLNTESGSDTIFTGTGLKIDRSIKVDAPAIKLGSGTSAEQQQKADLRQGELFWNTDVSILQVYTGVDWKSATGQEESQITIEDLEAINLTYNLIIN